MAASFDSEAAMEDSVDFDGQFVLFALFIRGGIRFKEFFDALVDFQRQLIFRFFLRHVRFEGRFLCVQFNAANLDAFRLRLRGNLLGLGVCELRFRRA